MTEMEVAIGTPNRLTETEMIQKLHNSVVEVLRLAISRLYHLSIEEIRIADPSLSEIIRLCSLFNKIVQGTDIDGCFTEAMEVLAEAADAARSSDDSGLTDCAYHLEDFLARIKL